jgi:hypothetical protein
MGNNFYGFACLTLPEQKMTSKSFSYEACGVWTAFLTWLCATLRSLLQVCACFPLQPHSISSTEHHLFHSSIFDRVTGRRVAHAPVKIDAFFGHPRHDLSGESSSPRDGPMACINLCPSERHAFTRQMAFLCNMWGKLSALQRSFCIE